MRRFVFSLSFAGLVAGGAVVLGAQGPPQNRGWILIPASTIERLEEIGGHRSSSWSDEFIVRLIRGAGNG